MKRINNVYVIDDDKIYHFLLSSLMKREGIEVQSSFFGNGQDAIDFIKKNNNKTEVLPDLILLDVNMPIMNGWQFLEEFMKIEAGLAKGPVIYMISSSNNEVDIKMAKEFDGIVKGYFLKPICKEDLVRIFS